MYKTEKEEVVKKIYIITDENMIFEEMYEKTKEALEAGIHFVQYRVKHKQKEEKLYEAKSLVELCKAYNTPLIINDDLQLAIEVGAKGVHLGKEDLTVKEARQLVDSTFIIGATAKTIQDALEGIKSGANYLGVGAIYPSPTKKNAKVISLQELKKIKEVVSVPLYAIGGLREDNLCKDLIEHVDGAVFLSAIYQSVDIKETISQIQYRLMT